MQRQGVSWAALAVLGAGTLVLATALAWITLRAAAVGYFAETDPARALMWDPNSVAALVRAADAESQTATTDAGLDHAAALARRALEHGPLDATALRILALDAERRGDDATATRIMDVVGRRTHRDTLAQAWMMNRDFDQGRFTSGLAHADSILQRSPEWGATLYPLMVAAFENPQARAALLAFLSKGQEWRRPFLADLASDAMDLEALKTLFLSLNSGPAPLTGEESGLLIARLINDQRYGEAQTIWRRLLPAPAPVGQGLVYDGGFAGAPGDPPFNWGLASDASAIAEIGQAPDGVAALYLRFPAAEPTPLAEQMLVLPPGRYAFSGRALYDEARRPEKLNWRLQCIDGPVISLATPSPFDDVKGWRAFSVAFEVPAQGCAGQWLQLGSQAEENFGMIEAWFTALAIRPLV